MTPQLLYVLAGLLVLVGLAGVVLPALPGLPLVFAGMLLAAWVDHFQTVGPIPLVILGVPIVDLQQDMSLYFDIHHTANDTLDKISKSDLDQVAAAYATFAFAMADMKDDLGRIPEGKRAERR